jgi:hypothetical protein
MKIFDKDGNEIPNDWPVWYKFGPKESDSSYFIVQEIGGERVLTWPNNDGYDMVGPLRDCWWAKTDAAASRIFLKDELIVEQIK